MGFERAVRCGDQEGVATRDLARLCRDEGQTARAAEFFQKFLQISRFFDKAGDDETSSSSSSAAATGIGIGAGTMAGEAAQRGHVSSSSSSSSSAVGGGGQAASLGALLSSPPPGGVLEGSAPGVVVGGGSIGTGAVDAEQAEAVLFLARFHLAQGDGPLAEAYCTR